MGTVMQSEVSCINVHWVTMTKKVNPESFAFYWCMSAAIHDTVPFLITTSLKNSLY